jgi:hypothetical protein
LFREQAQHLLASAEAEIRAPQDLTRGRSASQHEAGKRPQKDSVEQRDVGPPKLPRHPLTNRVAIILIDPAAIMRVLTFAFALQIELAAVHYAQKLYAVESGPPQFLASMLFVFTLIFGVPAFANWSVSMLAILQDTAGGKDEIESWPDLNFLDWILDAIYLPAALFAAALPGLAVGEILTMAAGGSLVAALPMAVAASLFLLFPVLMMSMLEAESPIGIFSSPVARSLSVATHRWIQFYGLAAALCLIAFGIWQVRRLEYLLLNFFAAVTTVVAGMIYFRLLGRLTWCCQEAVAEAENREEADDDDAPP